MVVVGFGRRAVLWIATTTDVCAGVVNDIETIAIAAATVSTHVVIHDPKERTNLT